MLRAGRLCAVIVLHLLVGACAYGAAAYNTLINNGPSSNRVDIVFAGDGYTSDLIDTTYVTHINSMVSHLFSEGQDPFPRYAKFFNVHRVNVVSNQTGADVPPLGIYRDTALDSSYYWDGLTDRLLYANSTKVNNAISSGLSGSGITADIKLVTVNDARYGGGGGSFAVYAGGNGSATEVALHEMGHSFGGLADEYDYGSGNTYTGSDPWEPNVTTSSTGSKWSQWLGYVDPAHPAMSDVGAYDGARYYQHGIYRPTSTSKMRELGQPFNAPSREALILAIYNYVHPVDSHLGNTGTLQDPAQLWVHTVDPNVISVSWLVDGNTIPGATGETFEPLAMGVTKGQHTITATAEDLTDWVRAADRSSMTETVTWTVNVTAVPEPAGLMLIGIALVILPRRRRN